MCNCIASLSYTSSHQLPPGVWCLFIGHHYERDENRIFYFNTRHSQIEATALAACSTYANDMRRGKLDFHACSSHRITTARHTGLDHLDGPDLLDLCFTHATYPTNIETTRTKQPTWKLMRCTSFSFVDNVRWASMSNRTSSSLSLSHLGEHILQTAFTFRCPSRLEDEDDAAASAERKMMTGEWVNALSLRHLVGEQHSLARQGDEQVLVNVANIRGLRAMDTGKWSARWMRMRLLVRWEFELVYPETVLLPRIVVIIKFGRSLRTCGIC